MSKKKTSSTQDNISVKLSGDVVEVARIVAAADNVTITDLLSDMVRPLLLKRRAELGEKWAKEAKTK